MLDYYAADKNNCFLGCGCSSQAECLLSICKTLDLIPSREKEISFPEISKVNCCEGEKPNKDTQFLTKYEFNSAKNKYNIKIR